MRDTISWEPVSSVNKPIVVSLKRFKKSEFTEELQRKLSRRIEHTIWDDVEKSYYEAIFRYGQTEIKIKTHLLKPQVYMFASFEVEIINEQ